MSHKLEGAMLKLERANEHINSLNRSIDKLPKRRRPFFAKNLTFEKLPDGSKVNDKAVTLRIINAIKRGEPPLQWSAFIGDAITNLRGSLDYLAWELSHIDPTKVNDSEQRRIQFPILNHSSQLNSDSFKDAVKFMSVGAVTEIKKFQPYNRGDYPATNLLSMLQVLSNIDKHRFIIAAQYVVIRQPHGQDIIYVTGFDDDSDGLVTYFLEPDKKLKPDVRIDVSFKVGDPIVDGYPVVLTLREIHYFISKEIFPTLSRFV